MGTLAVDNLVAGRNTDRSAVGETSVDDVIEVYKRTGDWQAKTEAEQKGWIQHMHEEHVSPKDVDKMATKAGIKTIVLTHFGRSLI